MKDSGAGLSAKPARIRRMGANIAFGGALNWGNLPSPCPSPHGRGDVVAPAAAIQASPLPEGEGQGEGLNAPSMPCPINGQSLC